MKNRCVSCGAFYESDDIWECPACATGYDASGANLGNPSLKMVPPLPEYRCALCGEDAGGPGALACFGCWDEAVMQGIIPIGE